MLSDGCSVCPVRSARDLGIYVRRHVKLTVSRCFCSLRRLRQIHRSILPAKLQMLVVALVHMVPDYGNGVLVGLLAYLIRQLQSVLNAAARLIYCLRSRDHITDAVTSLHWLRVPERIQYKLVVLAYSPTWRRVTGPLVGVADLCG